jgi:hypothetical protein
MKKKSFPPSKLKRSKIKAPWAFPLPERKTNPHPPQNKTCMEKSSVQMETGQSTIHTKYSLKKKPPLQPPTNPQIWGHSHLSYKLDEVPPKVFILYIFWRHANLIGPITQRNETMETSQNRSSILKHIVPPLYR